MTYRLPPAQEMMLKSKIIEVYTDNGNRPVCLNKIKKTIEYKDSSMHHFMGSVRYLIGSQAFIHVVGRNYPESAVIPVSSKPSKKSFSF